MTTINGVTHISLSVSDLGRSERFYRQVFDTDVVVDRIRHEDYDETILMIPGRGQIGLCLQAHRSNSGESFRPDRSGLDHVAFGVDDLQALEAWARRLHELGISHSEVTAMRGFGHVITLRDPDDIQLELHTLE